MKHLLAAADRIREETGSVVALLTAESEEGLLLAVAASARAVASGFDSGAAVRDVARAMGGGGGGRPDLGRGKGPAPGELGSGVEILRQKAASLPS